MKTQKEIEDKLTELEKFCADENFTIFQRFVRTDSERSLYERINRMYE